MGILDEAIREHLELKRQHGADDSELKELEDEAFGPPARPGEEEGQHDPLAEAPTEFMPVPPEAPAEEPKASEGIEEDPSARREPVAEVQEAPSSPAAEESTEPSTEERERMEIASHPTEMYDVEEEIAASQPSPSEEELLEEEMNEPRLAPIDPVVEPDDDEDVDEEEEDEDDFFDEQRLSEELDQALEAPDEVGAPADSEEFEAVVEEEEDVESEDFEEEDEDDQPPPAGSRGGSHDDDEDVLEDTPDFLEDSEDDQLWFEQKPPKDFDFDD